MILIFQLQVCKVLQISDLYNIDQSFHDKSTKDFIQSSFQQMSNSVSALILNLQMGPRTHDSSPPRLILGSGFQRKRL